MHLPVPGRSDLRAVLERGSDAVEQLVSVAPRLMTLLGDTEKLLTRVDQLIDRIEQTRDAANTIIDRTDALVDRTEELVSQTSGLNARLTPILDGLEPPLVRLQPTLDRLAETTSAREVDAVIELIDMLPDLMHRLESDILPVLDSLSTVAPDVHDLLDVTRQANDLLTAIPGVGRIKKRAEVQQPEG